MTPFFSQPGGKYHLKAGADEQEHHLGMVFQHVQ
jgi:hypothetical protein